MTSAAPFLRVQGLRKRYGNGVLANDDISFDVERGTVHAIVGENGAGKSTVLKMLYGLEAPDAGAILLNGEPRRLRNPAAAIDAGLGLVPQHLQLLPSMTVMQNIVLGDEPVRGPFVDQRQARQEVRELAERYGMQLDPDSRVGDLSAGEQQRVEILKTLRRGARLLLLDEPSALLTPQESQRLFDSLKELIKASLTIVLITHKMAEVRHFSDSFTVMRAGRVVGRGVSTAFDEKQMAELIVGRSIHTFVSHQRTIAAGRGKVQVRELSLLPANGRAELVNLSFDIAAGEILGVAAVEGNGQNRLCEVLLGLRRPSAGRAAIDGQSFLGRSVRQIRKSGIACVSEDRLHNGMAPDMSIAENAASLDYFNTLSRGKILDLKAMAERAIRQIQRFAVKAPGPDANMRRLSGGNMQKLVLARELESKPRFLILNQPTRGVDLGAAQVLHQAIVASRDHGAAVLLVSADLDEVLKLSDRIIVMFEGCIVGHFAADQVDAQTLGRYMTGMSGRQSMPACLDSPFTRAAAPTSERVQ